MLFALENICYQDVWVITSDSAANTAYMRPGCSPGVFVFYMLVFCVVGIFGL